MSFRLPPKLRVEYSKHHRCAIIWQGEETLARVYGADKHATLACADLLAAAPLLVEVLKQLDRRPPHRGKLSRTQALIELALMHASGELRQKRDDAGQTPEPG